MGMDELADCAGLPDPWLTHQRHDLAMPRPGPLQGLLERSQLLLPSHEAGEPPCCTGL
jgi:hypothetical protein